MIRRMPSARVVAAGVLAAVVGVLALAGRVSTTPLQSSVFPGTAWERISDPTAAGYCQPGLDAATARAKELATTGMTVIVGGRVLWDYGDQQFISYLASVRKSILAMMFGKPLAARKVKLDQTMAELGIDDLQPLLPEEKKATVGDLLAARSGVYHEAANAACTGCGSTMGDPPGPRGTVPHGTYFLYNNWDFNALGTIFENATGQNIYDVFEQDFAKPMQFQDFDRAQQRKTTNARASMHPAYHFYLSTRDMARIGYLMLREGRWNGKEIVERDWVKKITKVVTPVDEMNPANLRKGPFGYGYLWWIWDGPFNTGAYRGAYTGSGAIGQFITVLPALDMVVAHKTRQGQPNGASVSRQQYLSVVDAVIAAKCK